MKHKSTNEVMELLTKLALANFKSKHGDLPIIERGTAEWQAWRAFYADNGCSRVLKFMDCQHRYTVPQSFPPPGVEQLRELAGSAGKPKLST